MRLVKAAALAAIGSATAFSAQADNVNLRIMSHYATEHPMGQALAKFVDDVQVMSGGDITIQMFYSASLVPATEAFDAAVNGILDCETTGASYVTGKNPAFQFLGDLMGGYETPWQFYSWLYYAGGKEEAQQLYNQEGMELVGWANFGQELMSSSKPLAGPEDLKGWKFRSPPGMETEIFQTLGATPVVMDFTEIFTALETGIIDGADAGVLSANDTLGIYDIVKHATYPGFHAMPSDHLACNKGVWDGLTEQQRRIIETAWEKLSFQIGLFNEFANAKAAAKLLQEGVTLYDWSSEDRQTFRNAAMQTWETWGAKNELAGKLLQSHKTYLTELGLLNAAE